LADRKRVRRSVDERERANRDRAARRDTRAAHIPELGNRRSIVGLSTETPVRARAPVTVRIVEPDIRRGLR